MLKRTARLGFTLLEMMVVIVIIGILSTYLVVNAPEWFDRARMTASEKNMGRLYVHLLGYQQNHNGSLPSESGQRFFLRPWKDGMIEKTEQQAIAFFSPAHTFEECLADQGLSKDDMDVVTYLNNWEAIGPGYTSYSGFTTGGDPDQRRRLSKSPGSTAIVADAEMWHRSALIYLTADGATHRLLRNEIEEQTGLNLDDEETTFKPGPGCGVKVLETVSND